MRWKCTQKYNGALSGPNSGRCSQPAHCLPSCEARSHPNRDLPSLVIVNALTILGSLTCRQKMHTQLNIFLEAQYESP